MKKNTYHVIIIEWLYIYLLCNLIKMEAKINSKEKKGVRSPGISMPLHVKERGIKASKQMFGRVNLSGYIQVLINSDCDKKNIE
jgi:hypothetical protein